jgi:hypothetical protein
MATRTGRGDPYAHAQVEFKEVEEIDKQATAAHPAGIPQFKKKIILEVVKPGGDKTPVEVTDYHKQLYPEKWAAFQSGREQPIEGTPLTQWAMIPASVVQQLAFLGIRSVEQLAQTTGDIKKQLGPLATYCKQAKNWLESANSTQSQVTQLKAELDKEREARKKLEEHVHLLLLRIESSEGTRMTAG